MIMAFVSKGGALAQDGGCHPNAGDITNEQPQWAETKWKHRATPQAHRTAGTAGRPPAARLCRGYSEVGSIHRARCRQGRPAAGIRGPAPQTKLPRLQPPG